MVRSLQFSSCSVTFDHPEKCSGQTSSNYCNAAFVNITVTEDFSSNFDVTHGQLSFSFLTDGDPAWNGMEGKTLNFSIANLPTSQCHVFTEPHVITFDQHRYDFYGTGTFLLQQNVQDDFEVSNKIFKERENYFSELALIAYFKLLRFMCDFGAATQRIFNLEWLLVHVVLWLKIDLVQL